ncbi:MAG: SH3 domain-containing protein [Anaerolineae bacterium]|nr:SH3 domain-containing protein [Anaerolineae bacterium]
MRTSKLLLAAAFILGCLIFPAFASPVHAQGDESEILYGPEDGELEWPIDYILGGLDVRDFALHLRLYNPYAASRGSWVFGIIFRTDAQTGDDGYILVVGSAGQWVFADIDGSDQIPLDTGTIRGFDTSGGGSNEFDLLVNGELGVLSVNGREVASVDVSDNLDSGEVVVLAGTDDADAPEGAVARYEELTISSVSSDTVSNDGGSGDSDTDSGDGSDGGGSATVTSDCVVTTTGRVFLREFPVENAPIIVTIAAGAQMDGSAQYADDSWIEVTYGGQIGWVANRNISGTEACADLPAAFN